MLSFNNDYSEGAHERILKALVDTNFEKTIGYGEDEYCEKARQLIKEKIKCQDCDVYFISGGTQTNMIAISNALKSHEAVIACSTGHISVHETGAIEATGHKVIEVSSIDSKLRPEDIEKEIIKHYDHHMVKPKMIYISNATELGDIYSKKELEELSNTCKKYNLYLFLDGARLASALAANESDLTLEDYARCCDMFYIGGTKCGLLFGEALVVINPLLRQDILFTIKQRGGLFAKGRLLGIQFLEMFKDDLYIKLGKHANKMADYIKNAFLKNNYKLDINSKTNLIFVYLTDNDIEKLEKDVIFSYEPEIINGYKLARFVTSWATKKEDVDKLVKIIENL